MLNANRCLIMLKYTYWSIYINVNSNFQAARLHQNDVDFQAYIGLNR